MIKFSDGAHWYACNDDQPKPQHDATLREARKEGLYPSVTTIDKSEFVNVFLDKWKMNELVIAASENFRMPHESAEEYGNRIYQISLEKSKVAAAFGTELHDAIEHYPQYPLDPKLHLWMDHFGDWYRQNVTTLIGNEIILFDHDLGVAGRTDFVGITPEGREMVMDIKTQNIKKDDKGRKKPNFYDSWCRQLAFYGVARAKSAGYFTHQLPVCVNVVMDSNEPCPPVIKVWTDDEIKSAYEDFVIAAYRFFKSRNFWPAKNGPFSITTNVPQPA